MRRFVFAGCVLGLMASAFAQDLKAPVYFVATNGNDAWSGTLPEPDSFGQDGPFATLLRARDALRTHGAENGLPLGGAVYVRGGVYFLDQPLELGKVDSGTADNPVIWQAYRMESVRIVGGRPLRGFTPYKEAIQQCELKDVPLPIGQLFFNGARQVLARWPNRGESDMPGGAWAFVAGANEQERNRSFHYAGDRPAAWGGAAGAQVSIWPNYNWWQTIADVESIDPSSKSIRLTGDLPYTIEPGRRFFVQNVFEELDAPGEWFYNPENMTLYFWPPDTMENAEVVVPVVEQVVHFNAASNINFIAFTVEAARGDGIALENCQACLVARCVVRNTGGFAVTVKNGTDCRVQGNDIYQTGRGGIVLGGGDRKTLTPGKNQALNNHIHHIGCLYQTYQTGVNVEGVGNRVANNLIHDTPHIGILLGGNDHIIEYNDIHHVCLEGSDNGAFYMGRDWTQRGNVIQFNKFHDIYGFGLAGLGSNSEGVYSYESPHQAWGIYLDDCSSGVKVFGNVFYRVPLCGVMIGGGRDNVVENNVFVDSIPALHIDDRWDSYCWDVMQERLDAMNYKNPPYSERYPELLKMGDDPRKPQNNRFMRNIVMYGYDDFRGLSTIEPGSNAAVIYDLDQFDPASTVFDKNIVFHYDQDIRIAWRSYKQDDGATLLWKDWQAKGFDETSIINYTRFVDPDKDDYDLWMNPAAAKLEIRRIFTDRIGLYHDEFRASWPVPKDERRDGLAHRQWKVSVAPEGAAVESMPPRVPEAKKTVSTQPGAAATPELPNVTDTPKVVPLKAF